MNWLPYVEQRRAYACRRGVLRVPYTLVLTEAPIAVAASSFRKCGPMSAAMTRAQSTGE